ncbi:hypothetical protein ACHEXK_11095 [Limnohabitans sp. DCL3]|uniref:hypothetical protein n=1 Tax=Limnohabitans sp. DCL3 TaxID=3374103 RepID=UPI003A89E282
MPLIKINGLAYEFDNLDEEAKGHLRYLAFIDAELEQLAMRMTVMKISRDQIGQRLDAALLRQSVVQSPPELAQRPQSVPSGSA